METSNKLFGATVKKIHYELSVFRKKTGLVDDLYISQHFCERIVERNLNNYTHFIFVMLSKVVQQKRQTTYSNRIYKLRWKTWIIIAKISTNDMSGKRYVIAKTIYNNDDPKIGYDEEMIF